MSESFLQSIEWEEIQRKLDRKTWRIENNLIICHNLPAGFSYLYAPKAEIAETSEIFFRLAAGIAEKERSIFLKVEPLKSLSPSAFGGRESNSLQPRSTIFLDLTMAEEDLLRAMSEKTRYNIRLAERKGVSVRNPGARDFHKFWEMLVKTAWRDKFYLHQKSHYEKLFEVRSRNFSNELFLAEYRGQAVAGAMINFFGPSKTSTYLHGASTRENREVMGPHLLHWRIIQEAKRRGLEQHDFGGVDIRKWPGVTRFKKGFGGSLVEFPRAMDIAYRPLMYTIYSMARKIL